MFCQSHKTLTPFIVASAEFGEKSVPAWMELVRITDDASLFTAYQTAQ
jgi:hypothetical protein